MLIQAILAACWGGLARVFSNQMAIERPIMVGTVVGLIYGNLPLGLAIGGTLELLWMGVEGIGGQSPADVTVSTIFATAVACQLGYDVNKAVTVAVPVSLLARLISTFVTTGNSFFHRKFEVLADQGDIDGLTRWTLYFYPYTFAIGFLINFTALRFGAGPVSNFLNSVPAWVSKGLGTAGGMLTAIGFAMVLRMMFKGELLPFLVLGFTLGAYLNLPILGVAFIATAIAVVIFQIRQQIKAVEGGNEDVESGSVD